MARSAVAMMPQAYNIAHYRYTSPGVHAADGLEPQFGSCDYYDFLGK